MHQTALVTLNMRELDRLKVIQAVVDLGLKPGRAAGRLGLTVRQIERLVIRYRESGAAGLTSRKRDRAGNRRLDEELARRALSIIRDRYADFGPTLACEKLWECHGIRLAKETVRKLMTDAGSWIPRRQRPPKVYQPRARRACPGELIQIDGSDHRWFEERAPACTLLVYVDDATSRLMHLHFTQTESTFSYFEATRTYIERHGKPGAFYSDKASVFRNVKPGKTGNRVTPFGRAMYELNIDTFCANSSSAKVEAINTVFPETTVQTCIVHLIRNSLDFASWKDGKSVAAALKEIYRAPSAEAAAGALNAFDTSPWGTKYPPIAALWRRAWDQVIPFYAFAPDIRKIVYTTNAIESLHMQLRKIIKARGHFPSDEAALKLIWLALRNVVAKWTGSRHDWKSATTQFALLYPERFNIGV